MICNFHIQLCNPKNTTYTTPPFQFHTGKIYLKWMPTTALKGGREERNITNWYLAGVEERAPLLGNRLHSQQMPTQFCKGLLSLPPLYHLFLFSLDRVKKKDHPEEWEWGQRGFLSKPHLWNKDMIWFLKHTLQIEIYFPLLEKLRWHSLGLWYVHYTITDLRSERIPREHWSYFWNKLFPDEKLVTEFRIR